MKASFSKLKTYWLRLCFVLPKKEQIAAISLTSLHVGIGALHSTKKADKELLPMWSWKGDYSCFLECIRIYQFTNYFSFSSPILGANHGFCQQVICFQFGTAAWQWVHYPYKDWLLWIFELCYFNLTIKMRDWAVFTPSTGLCRTCLICSPQEDLGSLPIVRGLLSHWTIYAMCF